MKVKCKSCGNEENIKKEELENCYNWKCSKCHFMNKSPLNESNFSVKYNCSMPTAKRGK